MKVFESLLCVYVCACVQQQLNCFFLRPLLGNERKNGILPSCTGHHKILYVSLLYNGVSWLVCRWHGLHFSVLLEFFSLNLGGGGTNWVKPAYVWVLRAFLLLFRFSFLSSVHSLAFLFFCSFPTFFAGAHFSFVFSLFLWYFRSFLLVFVVSFTHSSRTPFFLCFSFCISSFFSLFRSFLLFLHFFRPLTCQLLYF